MYNLKSQCERSSCDIDKQHQSHTMYYLIVYDQTNLRWVAIPTNQHVVKLKLFNGAVFGLASWEKQDYNPSSVRIPSDPFKCVLARVEKADEFLDYGMVIPVHHFK